MIKENDQIKLARITLELHTPLAIGSGMYDSVTDQPFVVDANGLPIIPGTSLAGVWRKLVLQKRRDALFGARHGKADGVNDGEEDETPATASPVLISFAHIHDAADMPVDGRKPRDDLANDAILGPLLAAIKPMRDQVRINQRGTAEGMGKFDRCIVPAGYRFTLELKLWHRREDAEQVALDWQYLQQALNSPLFRLGGGSCSGLGRLKPVRWAEASFNLRDPADVERFSAMPARLDAVAALTPLDVIAAGSSDWHCERYGLRFRDFWRIGQGTRRVEEVAKNEKPADLLPVMQQVVDWTAQAGAKLERRLYLPASSIKGTLRHRTEYYLRCLQLEDGTIKEDNTFNEGAVTRQSQSLFGRVMSKGAVNPGWAGRLIMDDISLPIVKSQVIAHNSIDHFTQGTRDGALFFEEMLFKDKFCLALMIAPGVEPEALAAFKLALEDLCEGRLALGASSSRGHGYVTRGDCELEQGGARV